MQYKFIINGAVVYEKSIPPKKQTCDIYDYFDYIQQLVLQYLRRVWLNQKSSRLESFEEWELAINSYINEARKTDEPKLHKHLIRIGDKQYKIQMVCERLKLLHTNELPDKFNKRQLRKVRRTRRPSSDTENSNIQTTLPEVPFIGFGD